MFLNILTKLQIEEIHDDYKEVGDGFATMEEMLDAFEEQLPEAIHQEFQTQIKWSMKNNTFGFRNFLLTRGFDLNLHFIDIWKGRVFNLPNSILIYFVNEKQFSAYNIPLELDMGRLLTDGSPPRIYKLCTLVLKTNGELRTLIITDSEAKLEENGK